MRISDGLLLAVLFVAMATDIKTGKIKNWLTIPAIVCGPLLSFIEGGKDQALLSLAGMGVMILVAGALMSLRMLGGGDAKLLVAIGSIGRLPIVTSALLFMGVAGGVFAVLALLRAFGAKAVVRNAFRAVWLRLGLRAGGSEMPGAKMRLPYSIPIAIGSAAALFWRL